MLRTTLLLVALLAIAGLSWWLRQSESAPSTIAAERKPQSDFFLNDFTIHQFDQDGLLKYEIGGTQLTHFPDDDSSIIEKPTFDFDEGNDVRWQIRARQATAGSEAVDELWLKGDVQITQSGNDNSTLLSTERLLVKPNAKIAHTDTDVLVKQGQATIVASSLNANLESGIVELTQVKGHYAH